MRKWFRRILGDVAALVAVSVVVLAIAISRDAPCGPTLKLAGDAMTMKAVIRHCYGPPAVLAVEQVERPVPADDQMLVKVRAAAINPLEWHRVRGTPYIMRLGEGLGAPKDPQLGLDFAGTVIAVGKDITKFKPGDAIFGGRTGALAEYVTVRDASSIAVKPENVSYEQAGSVFIAGLTALQALRDRATQCILESAS